MSDDHSIGPIIVRGTEIQPDDPARLRFQKLARITLDSMVQFVGLLDAKGTVLEINKVALDAVGIKLSEVEGKPFWTTFWWQVSEDVNRTLRESIQRAAQGEFVRWDTEIYGRAGGKETIIIDASLCPVKDDDGQVVFICAEGRDITEKKGHEREIAEKNVELQGLLERIRELDEIKTQFFANVSHELRTPLALILGPGQRLVDDNGTTMDLAQRREAGQVITRNARMLLKHVNDLLDMSKLEAGKLKIELVDTDVAAQIRFLAAHFAVLAAERGIDYEVDANDPCIAAVDPDKLQRVLMNLLANAFKFVPDGGRVRCGLKHSANELIVEIDDSGPGVKPELRRAIFERFRQADGGSNRKAGGTGLGLAIAKEFVEMHKGRIDVLDAELGGARFQITLPRHPMSASVLQDVVAADASLDRTLLNGLIEELRPRPLPRQTEVSAPSGVERPRVLVVEDNPDMNRFVSQCLASEYEVISAFDGREGLEMAMRFRPALIVSDIMMPNVSGDEMIAQMRRLPELHETPILLLSAKADEALMVRLLDNGAQDFVVKPFSEKDLTVRARNLIHVQQARELIDGLRKAAEVASRAKDEFLAILGHELRNPLSPIRNSLHLLRLSGELSPTMEPVREIMERQVDQMVRLIDDLLDVSRISRGRFELQKQTIELATLVSTAVETAQPTIEAGGHQLAISMPAEAIMLYADPVRLAQIIGNLLNNAAKYTKPGGQIWLNAHSEGGEAVISVRDTGLGIAANMLPRVFDMFAQIDSTLTRAQGGLGVGLTLAKTFVELHGGRIEAHSDGPDQGSEFIVFLPMMRDSQSHFAQKLALRNNRTSILRRQILIVDDTRAASYVLGKLLETMGQQIFTATDAIEALECARRERPDLVISDIGMPNIDGYEFARRLRREPGLEDVLLVALTGYGQTSDKQRAKEAGFDYHLVKPVSLEALLDLLNFLPARENVGCEQNQQRPATP
jgi:PAS domain S-box-containing protein